MLSRGLVIAALLGATGLQGQSLTLYGGETRFALGEFGGHTAFVGGVALAIPVTGFLRTDIAVLGFDYEGASVAEGWRIEGTRLATEIGFYVQNRFGVFRPYAGIGSGFSVSHRRRNNESARFGRMSETAHAALGADFGMGRNWGMRMDVRARAIVGPGVTTDVTIGFSRRLGRG